MLTARWPVCRLKKVLCREKRVGGEAWPEFSRLCVKFGRSSGRSFLEGWLQPSLPFFWEECDYGAVTCNTVKIREQYRPSVAVLLNRKGSNVAGSFKAKGK